MRNPHRKIPSYSDYADYINPRWFDCIWVPIAAWAQAHGDGKATTMGVYHTMTMTTSEGKYLVKVVCLNKLLDLFEVSEPSAEEVVKIMKERAATNAHKS